MEYVNLCEPELGVEVMFDEEKDDIYDLPLDWTNMYDTDEKVNGIHADTISDGLIYSLRNLGKVDIEYIAKITDSDLKTVIEKLKGSIYQDPECWEECFYKGFKTSDEYLSGNLLEKLNKAEYANKKYNGHFDINVEALKAVMPKGLKAGEIYYSISSPWIPKHIIKEFFNDNFLFYHGDVTDYITFDEITNLWNIRISSGRITYSVNLRYGTKRIGAVKILEHLLNSSPIAIYDSFTSSVDNRTRKELNREETALAIDKAKELNNAFKNYIESRKYLYDELVEAYNNKFGYNVARVYNGDFLELNNINPNVNLFKSQKDAIARIIFTNNTLLAYNVGAGKTYIMVAAGEELIRMGISKKNLYVVPNNIVSQWEKDYKYLYPNCNILVTKTTDFSPQKIDNTLRKIKDGNYSAIIMAHSSFDNIALSKEYQISVLQDKLDKLKYIRNKTNTIEQMEKSIKADINRLMNETDNRILFNDLGITRLFVDEAHNYKNIPLTTMRGHIKGINVTGSKKCFHMMKICEYMNSLDNGGIIMATGTPIANSISDIYSMQVYLQKGELKLLDINTFDNWLNMFTEESDEFEIDLDASKYRVVKRLSKFHNLPELTTILASVAAFYYDNDNNGLPSFNGYKDVVVPKSKELHNYIDKLSNRLSLVRHHAVKPEEDNLLKITTDGRKAALDIRLVGENYLTLHPLNKVVCCAQNVLNIYNMTKGYNGTQLIFCDTSVPGIGFNIYDALKDKLIEYGIPSNEIEYIHDASSDKKRDKLFKDMNDGRVRVLIGSTMKLGIGVNVQDRLTAIHHLDIPWRPADMVQREGRIKRIGNKCDEIFIYRYITEGSFDAYSWQILENKQRFIGELLNNSLNERSKNDIEETLLNYGEIKALAIGNPRIQEHVKLKNRLAKLKLLQKKYNDERTLLKKELLEIPAQKLELNEKIAKITNDINHYNTYNMEYSKDDKQNYASIIWNTLMDNLGNDSEIEITYYKGFVIKAPAHLIENELSLIVENDNRYHIDLGSSEKGAIIRIDNLLMRLPQILDETINKRDNLILREDSIIEELKTEIDYTSEIISLSEELKLLSKELNINE